ncbi:MAG: GTPase HflX [Planctomycetota bacterium]
MPEPKERQSIKAQSERAVLAAVRLPESQYDHADPFGELAALSEQAGAVIVGELTQQLDRPVAGSYMGTGKLNELKSLCDLTDASMVIFDHELSPKQIAKIEEAVSRKVVDRSELILDIFASRATTHEAKLQVELAQLEYTYPRLRAMWSHLERISGGAPTGIGSRGPGEQQLEIDRRLVQRKKSQLTRELREIQSRKRRSVEKRNSEHFTVGLVGYTNAGKSTLFNTLTAGGAYADDRVFATLMTRTRAWDLGGGLDVLLSDTVGFVRDLPHNLVASFKATLEEATHADLLLVVLDVSDPAAELHYETVTRTLNELFDEVAKSEHPPAAPPEPYDPEYGGPASLPGSEDLRRGWTPPPRVLLLNKADLLQDERDVLRWQTRSPGAIAISSMPDEDGRPAIGADELIETVRTHMLGPIGTYDIDVALKDARTIHAIESRGEVLDRTYEGDRVTLRAKLGSRLVERVQAAGASVEAAAAPKR